MEYNGFLGGSVCKETTCNEGDAGLIPGLGRSPGEGNGNLLQYSYLGNPMDRRAWATVNGVTRIRHDLVTEPPPPYIHTNIVSLKIIVQLLSCFQLFVTPWTAACHVLSYIPVLPAFLSYSIFWSLLKFTSTDLVMLANHLILCPLLLLLPSIFPSIRVFSSELALHIRWPKYWIQPQPQSFQWIFRIDFL